MNPHGYQTGGYAGMNIVGYGRDEATEGVAGSMVGSSLIGHLLGGGAGAEAGSAAAQLAAAAASHPDFQALLAQLVHSGQLAPQATPFADPRLLGGEPAGGPQVVQRTDYDMREFTLGFPLTTVTALATTLIISRPQVPFRGERLVVPASTASYFSINDVKVGNKSQLVNENALPAEMFSQLGVGVRQTFDTAQVSQDVSISVTNNDTTTARAIQPAIIGTAAN